jgi:RHH-type proline utilization regulon transcriptional repressor/proline dehydrogenase/delta 1-pyrroline-5-carboxylate dehydrogenase
LSIFLLCLSGLEKFTIQIPKSEGLLQSLLYDLEISYLTRCPVTQLTDLRRTIRAATLADEAQAVDRLKALAGLSQTDRARIVEEGARLVRGIRGSASPGLMEVFLAEYGLNTDEGVALMCLAEALLRVPDAETMDALIEDKIAPSDWGTHLGHSSSSLVNASTWGLMLTGKVLTDAQPGIAGQLRGMVKRLGEPVIRAATARAMKEMGRQFVLGETIQDAMARAADEEAQGYCYSYDMLGEAAKTDADALGYLAAYRTAIDAIAKAATSDDIRENPGISVKLSALYPRYEIPQRAGVMTVLQPRLLGLCQQAAAAKVGLNIDAEEADRLDLSLDVIEATLADHSLKGWDGFGVVVQAYGHRASFVIDWLNALAKTHDRKIMVRLVKGAYWDTEVKRAQVLGLRGFPVFTHKPATDISYIANARKLLGMANRIYPQFATHNAHTVAAILHMADGQRFEFQRLHGMGERLHDLVLAEGQTRCRIYAPVGAHRDLLAYLVRRLLENGANSSFVNQIVDEEVSPAEVASDPFTDIEGAAFPAVTHPRDLFVPRRNSRGWDWNDPVDMDDIAQARASFANAPLEHTDATDADVAKALEGVTAWRADVAARAEVLRKAADLYEDNYGEIFAILAREAGKTTLDVIGELREAVDFLRYYADEAARHPAPARGVFTCISPWNFPLAIFTGQVAAALATGNGVLAKPAEQTPVIARLAVRLLHEAGVPRDVLHLLPGGGAVGAALTASPHIDGVCFTGSTATAKRIHKAMAETGNFKAPLIAETGGLNAMIVDSTALPEQAVRDIVASAFQSAGQRCSALRCLYVQSDIAEPLTEMLTGAMAALRVGEPWDMATDIGPIIDAPAHAMIAAHIEAARADGRVMFETPYSTKGNFIPPTLIRVSGIADLQEEIFGPVLHIAQFEAEELEQVIDAINETGYGLTFGLHSRIDDRVQQVVDTVHAGNIYVNRNQIGAIVGSQPFGGEGLSGTGPKAGGPHYLMKFVEPQARAPLAGGALPGPTGESNQLTVTARAPILCLGPDIGAQMTAVDRAGGRPVEGDLADCDKLDDIGGVLWWGDDETAREIRKRLAARGGPILSLITGQPSPADVISERHTCIDTTASGGNAQLLAEVAG